MASVFEPIIIKFADETSGPEEGSGGGRRRGGRGGMSPGLAGVAGAIGGVAVLVSELVSIVKGAIDGVLQPVRTMLTGILKLIAQLLRPVVDVVMLLLMPILQFLRPIIRVANEVMRPFRVLAYGLMRQSQDAPAGEAFGLENLAFTAILSGVGNVLLAISGELMKMITGVMIDLFGGVLSFFGVNTEALRSGINDGIDKALYTIQAHTLASILETAIDIRKGSEDGILEMQKLTEKVISSANQEVGDKIKEMDFYEELQILATGISVNTSLLESTTSVSISRITDGFKSVGDALTSSITSMLNRARRAAARDSGDDYMSPRDIINTIDRAGRVVSPTYRNTSNIVRKITGGT